MDRARAKVRVFGYLENLFLKVPSFDLGNNFRIRRTFETERRQLYAWDGRVPDQGLPMDSIDALSVVVETVVETEWPPLAPIYLTISKEVSQANATLFSIPRALALFLDQIVKMKTVEPQQGDLSAIEEPAKFFPPHWAQSIFTKYRHQAVMGIEELETFKKFFWAFVSTEKPAFVRNAIGRFGWACDMAGESENIDYRFVDYIRSLEALLGGGSEITHTLALRTAALLGGSPDDRQNTYDFIKAAYRCRSGSVHGGRLLPLKFSRWKGTLRGLGMLEEIDMLHWYCQRSVLRIIDLIDAINRNEADANKWKMMSAAVWKDMSAEARTKHSIVSMLDYSLVRKDLAEALETFYDNSLDIDILRTKYERILGEPFTHPLMFDKT